MKCPMLWNEKWDEEHKMESAFIDCIKEECAWWYKENNTCAILTLAQGSVYLHQVLLAMEAKMPFTPKI